MTDYTLERENLTQLLHDADCPDEFTQRFLKAMETGTTSDQLRLLQKKAPGEGNAMPQLKIEVGGQIFIATLLDNPTTRALLDRLPMTISMSELNGNEKY